jgi:uncharacterized protein YlzI (FlbEa/FlbD family)
MILTTKEIVDRDTWLTVEILRSISTEAIEIGRKSGQSEIKLLINGIEHEPQFLIDLFSNIEKYVDREAERLVKQKFEEAERKIQSLDYLVSEAIDKIKTEFKLHEDDGD